MRKLVVVMIGASIALQLPGCATVPGGSPNGEMSQTGQGAAIGAIAGGLLGALITGDAGGAVAGALAGAATGALIGNYQDQQLASRAEATTRYTVKERRLELEGSSSTPRAAVGGSNIESMARYSLLAPRDGEQFRILETRTLVKGNESYVLSKREVNRSQGTHQSTFRFTLPKDISKGDYALVTTVSDGNLSKTSMTPLTVV